MKLTKSLQTLAEVYDTILLMKVFRLFTFIILSFHFSVSQAFLCDYYLDCDMKVMSEKKSENKTSCHDTSKDSNDSKEEKSMSTCKCCVVFMKHQGLSKLTYSIASLSNIEFLSQTRRPTNFSAINFRPPIS